MKVFKKPYVFWFFGILIFYLILNVIISGFYDTIPLIVKYARTVNWLKLGFSLLLTLVIGLLVASNSILAYIKYKERKKCNNEITLSGIGTLGGLATGICPLCVTGIFPLLLSLIGISFSFASLPFQGIEIQILITLILLVSLINLSK
ncbi:hypothetical protein J4221_02175 [Candidatus Pacearchaeota archaeon]|nr:hypothetical protein [Candidatus Pacearchaeota archaeon]